MKVTTNYESALMKAFKNAGAKIHGCHFHLCQAIWRFVHTHGLSQRYFTDENFRSSVRALMALPFLKTRDIRRRFLELNESVDDADLALVYDYFERTWIDGFGVELISQYNELFRTNNNAEAFHSSLRHVFFRAHPQFGEFVGKIVGVMETEAEYEAERLRPKQLDRRLQSSYKNIKNVVDNFYHDASLGLPLPKLLERIGDILHGDVRFEERYEQGDEATFEPVGDEFCMDGVPMEIADK